MQRFILGLVLLTATAVQAQPYHRYPAPYYQHGYWRSYDSGWQWVVPAVVGGAVAYAVVRGNERPPQTVIIERQVDAALCSPWTEIQNIDGTVTRTRTCRQ